MCGIVGLFLKDPALEPQLGGLLADMLVTMTDRGPDSAGIAIYGRPEAGRAKLTVQSADPDADFDGLARAWRRTLAAPASPSRPRTPTPSSRWTRTASTPPARALRGCAPASA